MRAHCHPLLASLLLTAMLPSVPAANNPVSPRAPTAPISAGREDWFEDVTRGAGLNFVQQFCHDRIANILLSNGSGGAVFDFDNDGWMDVYLTNWRPLKGVTHPKYDRCQETNRLYRSRGDGTFEDVTRRAGLEGASFASGAVTGDFDNDGFTDVYVVNVGRNLLYRNRGNGTFEDVTDRAGVGHPGTGISAVFLDIDKDGWLDLFVANYLTYQPESESEQNPGAYPGPLAYPGEPNVLYRNKGNGTFEDITRSSGLLSPGHRGMSVSAFDADWDGDTDLYLSNDDTPNHLWLNDGKGHFHEAGMLAGVAFNAIGEAPGSMNAAVGDVNGDGWPDLFVTRFGYGSLYVRTRDRVYEDQIYKSGLGLLTRKYVGWGGAFIDFDNDTDLDLVVANGSAFVLDGSETLLLENQGNGQFKDASAKGGAVFKTRVNGRGNAILDFDNDGRLDVLLTALADRVFLLKNRVPADHHWLKLRLHGTRSNRNGYGARITLKAGDWTARAEALCPTGFLTQADPRVHFGLGARTQVDTLEILWPSGAVQSLKDVAVDRVLDVTEPKL
jgi:enediyne biosynthesis protein E4